MFGFNVITYNIGTSIKDFNQLSLYCDPSIQNKEITEDYEAQYEQSQKTAAHLILKKAAIYCLQELGANVSQRLLVARLIENNFEIACPNEEGSNTAIALDLNQFKDVKKYYEVIKAHHQQASVKQRDITIVAATHVGTNERMVFVSAHVPGFEYEQPTNKRDEDFKKIDREEGYHFCSKMLEVVSKIAEAEKATLQMIGADMNASPEMDPIRFQLLKQKGFELIRSGSHTNVSPLSKNYRTRELDFIFIKSTEFSADYQPLNEIKWTTQTNGSDHIPVAATVEIQMEEDTSILSQTVAIAATAAVCAYIVYKLLKI
jgi:endonuclease/exonuclease/phosphatase family metal-dependent hydrolase